MDSFGQWARVHSKSYESETERQSRYSAWLSNLDYVDNFETTHPNAGFTVGMNIFADLSLDEFRDQYLQHTSSVSSSAAFLRSLGVDEHQIVSAAEDPSPSSSKRATESTTVVDWRTRGAVTYVKDQSTCGCCYVFAAVAAIESNWAIAKLRGGNGTASVEVFSEQHVLDCCGGSSYSNLGCDGGYPSTVLQCARDMGGVMPESLYQDYQKKMVSCRTVTSELRAPVKTYKSVGGSEAKLAAALINGPAVIPIRAYTTSFQLYTGGIYQDSACDGNPLDHVILAVGYNDASSPHYYIVKNSWSTHWGINGYVHIIKDYNNFCKVASYAFQPVFNCIPQDCSSLNKACGTWDDGCGSTVTCGPCDSGESCNATLGTCTCVSKKTCASLGAVCGSFGDGCGGTLQCGTCPTSGPHCNATRGTCDCTPETCETLGMKCGEWSDGCDSTVSCGTCVAPNSTCHDTLGYCYCKPAESCSELGRFCGTWSPGCGAAKLKCGNCSQLQNSKAFCTGDGYCVLPVSTPILFAAAPLSLPSLVLLFFTLLFSLLLSLLQ